MRQAAETSRSPTETAPLEALLGATARGEREAFRRLYEATSAKLFGVVLRIVRNRDAAEDVLQEVYLRIWNHAGAQRHGQGSALGWMISIARNRALDWRRSDRGEASLEETPEFEAWSDPAADTAALAEASISARALHRCLKTLDGNERSCIVLSFMNGYSHQELADRLRSPLGSVKSWIRRGQIRLKECLER